MQVSDVYEQLAKLPVDSYGVQSALSEVAELTIHGTMVYVKPYDPAQVGYLEKKIMKCGLGLIPSNDGRSVRVPIPQKG
jgi:ribosome recycling factor